MIRIDLIRMARTCLLAALILAAGFDSRLARAQAQAPAADPADEASADSLSYERGGLLGLGAVAGLKLGGGFGAPFNEMAASFVGELELGYNLPVLQRALGIFLSGQYAAPSMEQKDIVDGYASGGGSRLPGPSSYTLTTSEAMITLGAVYRIAVPVPLLRPYVGLGGRYVMMSTEVSGEAGGAGVWHQHRDRRRLRAVCGARWRAPHRPRCSAIGAPVESRPGRPVHPPKHQRQRTQRRAWLPPVPLS